MERHVTPPVGHNIRLHSLSRDDQPAPPAAAPKIIEFTEKRMRNVCFISLSAADIYFVMLA